MYTRVLRFLHQKQSTSFILSDYLLSHSNSYGNTMGKDTAGCWAFNRNYIVGVSNISHVFSSRVFCYNGKRVRFGGR